MAEDYIEILNGQKSIMTDSIPVIDYVKFKAAVEHLFEDESCHCLSYYAIPLKDKYKFICCIGQDSTGKILVLSHEQPMKKELSLDSVSAKLFQFHIFEREIYENYGINFTGHPWLKPVRYAFDRNDMNKSINNYPFYSIKSEELHEVGVGPIHAGVIEPGYFRFICNGENVLHLEIQLGFQHRGIEKLFIDKQKPLQQAILAESIAGDTSVGHALCYAQLMESFNEIKVSGELEIERIIALELERIAMHIGDTAALCGDVAYQLGQVTCEALRTIIINTTQYWCGNRFGKGLIRPFITHYPLTTDIIDKIKINITDAEMRYKDVSERIFSLPSVLARFEDTGRVTEKQAELIGAVGMAARSSGMKRDVRWSHPFQHYKHLNYEPAVFHKGDVWSRAMLRKTEIEKSFKIINDLLDKIIPELNNKAKENRITELAPSSFSISLTEGWRGEICHTALTDEKGRIMHYKIKDPSMHNWLALAMAVRGQEISDFPLCNKSFNLSYCGHDL